MLADTDRAIDALHAIPPNLARDEWVRVGMAAKSAGIGFDTFHAWSAGAGNYQDERDVLSVWNSIRRADGVTAATLFKTAAGHGWRMGGDKPQRAAPAQTRPVEQPRNAAPGMAAAVWGRCEAATNSHGYIAAKGAAGVPLDTLRVVPAGDSLRIAGQSVAGFLMVPAYAPDGALQSAQFIPPLGAGKKVNLPGACMAGATFTVGPNDGPAHLCEGIGAAWAVWQATGHRAVCCFGWGNIRRVAEAMRERDASARLVLVPDTGKEVDAAKIAVDVGAAVAAMPPGWPDNSDVSDLARAEGGDALVLLLEAAKEPLIVYPLSVAFADELPDTYTPPDELVQGVLTAGDGSVLYGDSNSGKTFFVIDMAAAVARGVEWMGRKTEPGLVVYLAAESPASVRGRLQAYQKHHGVKVPNFAIVQSPIDLFDGDADTNKVIKLVRMLEVKCGQPVRLIIGDTLARLSAGANENAGQDMGLVVRRFDRIRSECKAHFLLIHHSGKAAANGARGWSGIRAAVDTEIEVTDSPTGRCAEITKQRDLSTKGERIGFRLDPVTLGTTKWGSAATSCVVVAADAPAKQTTGKRMSECDGAVLEFLVAHKIGIKKRDVVTHFQGRYEKGPIYRAMKSLVTAAAIHEAAGMVCAAGAVK